MRKRKSTQGGSADAVELNDDADDRRRRPLPLPVHLVVLSFSLLARLARLVLSKLLPASFLPHLRRYRKWRSTRLRGRAFGAPLPPDERDDDRDQRPPPLPTDAGLAALRLANCRDLASACDPPLVTPGRLFRSASPFAVCGGGGGGGDEQEGAEVVAAAAEEAARALSVAASAPASHSSSSPPLGLNLALVIDLRSANEWEAGNGAEALRALEELSSGKKKKEKSESGNGNGECTNRNGDGSETTPLCLPRVERVALQEWTRYTHAFVARLPATRSLGAAAHFLLFKYLLGFKAPIPGMHARLCLDTERGGLLAMNTAVLAAFPLEIARVLRLVTSGIISGRATSSALSTSCSSSSVMVACKLGKDRTGLVSALCLAVAGASRREVVPDYARSATELAGRPAPATAPSLGGAPSAAMERSLGWLSEHFARFADGAEMEGYCRDKRIEEEDPRWRAGVLGYLDREARFLAGEREALRRALTEK